jgi:hypothetical protein
VHWGVWGDAANRCVGVGGWWVLMRKLCGLGS